MYNNSIPNLGRNMSDNRNGGFLFPFILGTLVSPLFGNKNNNKPCCCCVPNNQNFYPIYPNQSPYIYPNQFNNYPINQYQPDYYQNLEVEKNYYL